MKRVSLVALLTLTLVPVLAAESVHSFPSSTTIGLVPSVSPAITNAIADGARLALERAAASAALDIELVVAAGGTQWSTASAPAVEIAFGSDVIALITPPDRATAHLIAQIGSRAHIPVLTTTTAPSIAHTGSYWVIPLLEVDGESAEATREAPSIDLSDPRLRGFEAAFRERFGRNPDGWAATGYRAATAVCAAMNEHGGDRYRLARTLSSNLH